MEKEKKEQEKKVFDIGDYEVFVTTHNYILHHKTNKKRRYFMNLYHLFEKLYLLETDKEIPYINAETLYKQLKERDDVFYERIKEIVGNNIGYLNTEDAFNKTKE